MTSSTETKINYNDKIYCMTCGNTKTRNVFEQCTDCYNYCSTTRKFDPYNGLELEKPYDYLKLGKVCFDNATEMKKKLGEIVVIKRPINDENKNDEMLNMKSLVDKIYNELTPKIVNYPSVVNSEDKKLDTSVIIENMYIMYCIDATASMGPHINKAKEKIKDVTTLLHDTTLQQLKEKYGDKKFVLTIYVSVVAYRDFSDNPEFEVLDFTNDINQVHEFLGKLNHFGGGDIPEDIYNAFVIALQNKNWKYPTFDNKSEREHTTNIMILIADAPAHNSGLMNKCVDNHEGNTFEEWKKMMDYMKYLNIDFQIIQYDKNMEKMIEVFTELYNCDGFEISVSNLSTNLYNVAMYSDSIRDGVFASCGRNISRRY